MNRIERLRELEALQDGSDYDGIDLLIDTDQIKLGDTCRELLRISSELLSLVERLSEVDPWAGGAPGVFVCFECLGVSHEPDCPFLLLEQWKAESE